MSIANVQNEMRNTAFPAPSATPVKIVNVVNTALERWSGLTACLQAYGTTVPSGVAGYLSSCIFQDTDAAADSQILINEGTLSSCNFVACPTS